MKKIQLKESDLKRIVEMEVMQYSDNESVVKHFYTTLSDTELNIDDWKEADDSADVGGELNIDWTTDIHFDNDGFVFHIHINSVEGNIWYNNDWQNKGSRKAFKVSSKNGWKIEYKDLSIWDGKVKIESINVYPDRRLFKIT